MSVIAPTPREMNSAPFGSSSGVDRSAETGALIVNADDWGYDRETTDRILECATRRVISSASGMVFMDDSERAAALAGDRGIDVGLHLNLTEAYSGQNVPTRALEHQQRVARFLRRHRFSQVMYHPGLASSFEYATKAQLEEFHRIYGEAPSRIDGHHHMHLSENVLSGKLLPAGTLVRRSFSFAPGEKSWINRKYRGWVDRRLQERYQLVDFLYSIEPLQTERLMQIGSRARHSLVELETHPARDVEFTFLTSNAMAGLLRDVPIAPSFSKEVLRKLGTALIAPESKEVR